MRIGIAMASQALSRDLDIDLDSRVSDYVSAPPFFVSSFKRFVEARVHGCYEY